MTFLEATTAIEGTSCACFNCNYEVDELDDRCPNCQVNLVVGEDDEDEDIDGDGDDLDADDYDLGGEGGDDEDKVCDLGADSYEHDEYDFPDRYNV